MCIVRFVMPFRTCVCVSLECMLRMNQNLQPRPPLLLLQMFYPAPVNIPSLNQSLNCNSSRSRSRRRNTTTKGRGVGCGTLAFGFHSQMPLTAVAAVASLVSAVASLVSAAVSLTPTACCCSQRRQVVWPTFGPPDPWLRTYRWSGCSRTKTNLP